jgi:hypothetical protein
MTARALDTKVTASGGDGPSADVRDMERAVPTPRSCRAGRGREWTPCSSTLQAVMSHAVRFRSDFSQRSCKRHD